MSYEDEDEAKKISRQNNFTFNQPVSSKVLGSQLNQLSSDIQAFKKKGQKEHQTSAKAVVFQDDEKTTTCSDFFKSLTSSTPKKAISKDSEKTPLTPAPENRGFGFT